MGSMNNRERVFAALRHEQPDRTPYCVGFTQAARRRLVEYCGGEGNLPPIDNALISAKPEPAEAWREVEPDVWRDEFGVEWDRSIDKDIGVVRNRLVGRESVEEYVFPDAGAPGRYDGVRRTAENAGGRFVVANLGFSLFERAWTLAGMEEILIGMAAEPEFVHRLMDRILEYNLQVIERCCALPIDAMMFGDDWGQQRGVIMGPERWREFVEPRVRQMYGLAKSMGKYVFIHSCGKVDELFPDLIECGLDCFNPFQPEVMDVAKMKRLHGGRLSFYGGISTQKTLPYGTTAQVREEVRRLLSEVGRGGGYIAAPAHATPADAKPENIVAMLEALNDQ